MANNNFYREFAKYEGNNIFYEQRYYDENTQLIRVKYMFYDAAAVRYFECEPNSYNSWDYIRDVYDDGRVIYFTYSSEFEKKHPEIIASL